MKLFANDTPTPETMNILNGTGMTPFLAYIEQFTSKYYALKETMLQQVNE
jgi:hypothetical protein